MDLTQNYPRSPKEKMCGLVHLPRMIDKARAYKNKSLGEYIYPCPLDKMILNYLGVDDILFAQKSNACTDEEIMHWVTERTRTKDPAEKDFINRQILERRPDTQDRLDYFNGIRDSIDPSRTDIKTWVALLDLEEGRLD
ncbi:MAG: hypothetical protein COV67_08220 [Nitrospinae bacterium CG11_big_fil_rev_8_21_14_0_20_56_8]|nr:MAG: hypothetical protein COV67_08220 [Nitrospinae bacterium CG11_big_fil_rev_8_21_14_0_20_56_8]